MSDSQVSKVYFASVRARREGDSKVKKIEKLFNAAGFKNLFNKNDICAIKLHFGEKGNDAFVNPVFVRTVVNKIKETGGRPFLTDTNTLYKSSRNNGLDHMLTALGNGFGYATVDAPIIIGDGLKGMEYVEVPINKKRFQSVKIAEAIGHAQALIVLSHFKGHALAGFGGCIKNLGMGCACSTGKREQHSSKFRILPQKCTACGQCVAHCPQTAISWQKENDKKFAVIDKELCIACGECLTMCNFDAVTLEWKKEIAGFTERLVEYAYGTALHHKGHIGFINFVTNVTPECDCAPWSDAPLVPDIGILSSTDPVALDKACFDLVNAQPGFKDSHLRCNHEPGADKFKGNVGDTIGEHQFAYAAEIGMGSTQYELIEV